MRLWTPSRRSHNKDIITGTLSRKPHLLWSTPVTIAPTPAGTRMMAKMMPVATARSLLVGQVEMGLRLLMVNLFAGATPGLALQNVYQIMEYADSAKYHEAAKVMRRSSEGQGTK
jgi:hypothetical protein